MNKIEILIVEDEAIVALDIKRSIEKMGYCVNNMVTNYHDALQSVKTTPPDIILLDINLHRSQDGIEIAQALQSITTIPIIYLTAFADDATIERAVKTNPVGYLVKPFKREDLKSTLQLAIYKLTHAQSSSKQLYEMGEGYYYDTHNHHLFFQDYPIKLSHKEQLLIEMLIEAQGQIVPFATLEEHIWREKSVSQSALRTLLYRLRSKLEYKIIETIPAFGIKLMR